MNLRPHIVKQGEYLTQLAYRHGFDAIEVWNDPKNEELRELRKDMDILTPGDIIHIPMRNDHGLPFGAGSVNRYIAKVPKVPVNLRFSDLDRPMANERFVVEGGATPTEGTTDEAGRVRLMVPVNVHEVRLVFPERDINGLEPTGIVDEQLDDHQRWLVKECKIDGRKHADVALQLGYDPTRLPASGVFAH